MHSTPAPDSAPLWRRLAAILYDSLLLAALLRAATLPVTLVAHGTLHGVARVLYQVYLLAIIAAFFMIFWLRGGQTVGMRAWRLRVVAPDGGPIDLRQATVRFFVSALSWACLGLGFIWSLIDRERRTWHDLASDTRLIVLPKGGRLSDASQ